MSDLLLKGGYLIDPKNAIGSSMDLLISDGRVVSVDQDIPSGQAQQVIDVSGLYVMPGLVDIHMHAYATPDHPNGWAGDNSILPDGFSFRSGVTTMVDTGSAGSRNFADFRYRVIDRVKTRLFALVNIVGMGMVDTILEQNEYDMDVDRAAETARDHSDVVVGIKTAHYYSPAWTAVDRAIDAGERAGMPVMVDFGHFCRERPYYKLVTEKMRPGDISTHMYRTAVPHVDENGKILDYLHAARNRGVIFDVGHGSGSFLFRIAVPSVAQGFYPDSISTDLHVMSMNKSMLDMPTLMSKFLAMGMPLAEVVSASTINPAREIGHPELGHLSVGAIADVAVLNLMKGRFNYVDVRAGSLAGEQRLFCELTLKDGKVMWDWNGRTGVDFREMGLGYGERDVDTVVIP